MSEFTERMKLSFKDSLYQFIVFLVRLFSGVLLGLTIAVTNEAITHIGILVFMFILIVTMAVILRVTRAWSLMASTILFLTIVLLGVLFKLYIHTAVVG